MIDAAPRIGVLRGDGPSAVVAAIDARVLRCELERRLGPVTLDLRTDGTSIGDWRPARHAAWPSGIDARIELDDLRDAANRPASLMARTVAPEAAAVREAMLRHLGIIPDEPVELDDTRLAQLDPRRVRPTDLWLVARAASAVTVDDPDVRALATVHAGTAAHPLDARFDAVAERLEADPAVGDRLARIAARLAAERDELRTRLTDLCTDVARDRLAAGERIGQLEGELARWRDRARRAELGGDPPLAP